MTQSDTFNGEVGEVCIVWWVTDEAPPELLYAIPKYGPAFDWWRQACDANTANLERMWLGVCPHSLREDDLRDEFTNEDIRQH